MKVESIPDEIRNFLSGSAGRSLIINGPAGTGKTTLSLQILEELTDPDKSIYLSTRVSDESLYSQFPWLRKEDMRRRIIDSSRVLLEKLVDLDEDELPPPKEQETVTSARDFLKNLSDEPTPPPNKVDRSMISDLFHNQQVPELKRVYDRIDHILPDKPVLIVDSVEGVTHKYGLDQEDFIMTLQKDLVENSRVNMILVLEKDSAPNLEYLVDGVLTVNREMMSNRTIRSIMLNKLRATAINQPSYLVTLKGGRFTTFKPFDPKVIPQPWKLVPNQDDLYSSGIPDLDKLLGGGFKKGSYNVIDVEENVSLEEYFSIIRPLLINFLSHGLGIFGILTGGNTAEKLRNDLVRFIPEDIFDSKVRIGDHLLEETDKEYLMALGTRNKEEAIRSYSEALDALRGPDDNPIMDFTGFDTIEYLRGKVAVEQLFQAVTKIKMSQDLGIGIVKPGLDLSQEIMNMSDTYMKIIDIDKVPCIYGIKPKTGIYALVEDRELGAPHVELIPII